jgi:hypothetical protein
MSPDDLSGKNKLFTADVTLNRKFVFMWSNENNLSNDTSILLYKFNYCYVTYFYPVILSAHLSQHAKVATADGLASSDPLHKKSAGNLNMY